MLWKLSAALVVTCALALSAHGQVRYYINGSGPLTPTISADNPPNIDIYLNVASGSDINLHIFDSVGTDDQVGTITIHGTWPGRGVKVAVADPALAGDLSTVFNRPSDDVLWGLRDLGGLRFEDDDMRDHAAVSVTVRGDINGEVKAGMLYHIDARRSDDNSSGGTISGNLHSTALDGAPLGSDGNQVPSIAYVRSGWQITGDLIADGNSANPNAFSARDYSTWGSVGEVIAGPTSPATGFVAISGNFHCEWGQIQQIITDAQIGIDATHRSVIAAGVRIGRITLRGLSSSGDGGVLPVPVFADVSTTARTTPSFVTDEESSLALLETNGDYVGNVSLIDFYGVNDHTFARTPSERKGIFVGGKFEGDIDVKYSYQYGDMVARSFRGNIRIGQMLKGSIVALGHYPPSDDDLDGTIANVEIGLTNPSGAPRNNKPGFNGIESDIAHLPIDGAFLDDTTTGYLYQASRDHGAGDSVIRAQRSIGSIQIAAMSDRLPEIGSKFTRPRIEAPKVGFLSVYDFDTGSIWSGNMDGVTNAAQNLIADDYASITQIRIDCIGPKADLWIQDCPLLDIQYDVFGCIHVPHLEAGEIIRIHGRFGDVLQAEEQKALCYAELDCQENPHAVWTAIQPSELHSPRGYWADLQWPPYATDHDSDGANTDGDKYRPLYARILVREPTGFRGQVILDPDNTNDAPRPRDYQWTEVSDPTCPNGNNPDNPDRNAYWLGTVEVATGASIENLDAAGLPWVISTVEPRSAVQGNPDPLWNNAFAHNGVAHAQPEYRIKFGGLGGGSVGMQPFDLDHTNCQPASPCEFGTGCSPSENNVIPVTIITTSEFEDGILLTFFGPVLPGSTETGAKLVSLFACDAYGVPTGSDLADSSTILATVQPMGWGFSRVVMVKLLRTLTPGRYVISRYEDLATGYHGLICDQVAEVHPVDQFYYNFFLDTTVGSHDLWCDSADFNCDGDVGTDADIEAFFACLAGNCPAPPCPNDADFNNDGDSGTDADIEAFFRVLAGGPC